MGYIYYFKGRVWCGLGHTDSVEVIWAIATSGSACKILVSLVL